LASAPRLQPTVYQTENGQRAFGIKAELIPKILDVWLKARDSKPPVLNAADTTGVRTNRRRADEGSSHKQGLLPLLMRRRDGKTSVRPKMHFLSSSSDISQRNGSHTLSDSRFSFFKELMPRLKNISIPRRHAAPEILRGTTLNDLVWDRLAPGVKDELRVVNPVLESGRRKRKHRQWLTEELGNPKLTHHLGILEGLAMSHPAGGFDNYRKQVDVVLPSYNKTPLLAYAKDQRIGR